MERVESKCKGCTKRTQTCHVDCPDWLAYIEYRDKVYALRREKCEENRIVRGYGQKKSTKLNARYRK